MGAITRQNALINFLLGISMIRLDYPDVRRDRTVVDDYFGTKIADPYRWLEDIESNETKQFVRAQQNLTETFLSQIPVRHSIHERLKSVWKYARSTAPVKICEKYYTFENSGLQNQSTMIVRESLDEAKGRVFLDPNKLSADGTIALDPDAFAFSKNGEFFAYATSQSGSDWKNIYFMNVSSQTHLDDVLHYSKWPSLTWSHDSLGLFYVRYPALNSNGQTTLSENSQVYYHKVGSLQVDDILIAEFPKFPKRFLQAQVSDYGDYLVISGQGSFGSNAVHVISLKNGVDQNLKNTVIPVFPDDSNGSYTYVTNVESTFMFLTNEGAPNYKIISVAIDTEMQMNIISNLLTENETEVDGGRNSIMSTFLEEDPQKAIVWVNTIDTNKYLVCYLEDVKNTLELRSLRNNELLHKFELPAGSFLQFTRESIQDNEFFFRLENYITPGIIYRCQVRDDVTVHVNCDIVKKITVNHLDLDKFVTDQVFYPSKDGTLIPMYIVHKKSLIRNRTAPVVLYGYGGYGQPTLPSFSTSNLIFVDNFDGIYAVANIRGGGEYGEKWHSEGTVLKKQNVFDDFQAAAEYLIQNNYTHASKLSIRGGSNGGLLVGACVNQRPELYGAAIAQVGVMDMLRFQKFNAGYAWCSEFGCSDNKIEFESLMKYSPLHNIRLPPNESVQYPSMLVTTADHDDRVIPAHSFKYIAELQHTIGRSTRQTNPLLLRVDTKAGHGSGKPTAKQMDEIADIYSFLAETLNLKFTWDASSE